MIDGPFCWDSLIRNMAKKVLIKEKTIFRMISTDSQFLMISPCFKKDSYKLKYA